MPITPKYVRVESAADHRPGISGPRQHRRSTDERDFRRGHHITVWSYVDQLNISVLADHTVGDPHEVTDAMVRAFTEIRVTAGGGQLTKIANDAT